MCVPVTQPEAIVINVERTWIPDQRFAHKYMFSDRNAFVEVYKGWETLFPCKSLSSGHLLSRIWRS
jgi:hypothetical protein